MDNKLSSHHRRPAPPAEFEFGRFIKIYHPFMEQTTDETSAIIMHEVGHSSLAMYTAFGMFQHLLGYLNLRKRVPSDLRESFRTAYDYALYNSMRFHEGYACTFEMIYSMLNSQELHRHVEWTLDPVDRKAAEPLMLFLEKAQCYTALAHPVIEAIAEIILNTPILDDMKESRIFQSLDWTQYYASSATNPLTRYDIFANMNRGNLPQKVSRAILDSIQSRYDCPSMNHFLTRLQETFSSKQREETKSIVKQAAKSVLLKNLSFTALSDHQRKVSYKALFESWSKALAMDNIAMGKGPPFLTSSSHGDYFLNSIRYVPRKDEGSWQKLAIAIDYSGWSELYQILVESQTVIYVHIRITSSLNTLNESHNSSQSRHEQFSLYIHESYINEQFILFCCPLERDIMGPDAKTCVVHCEAKELNRVLNDLSRIETIIAFSQSQFKAIHVLRLYNKITKSFKAPIVVYPKVSTLNSWRNVIRSMPDSGDTYIYHNQIAKKPYRALDLCYATTKLGNVAYVSPMLHLTYDRLVEMEPKLKVLNEWHYFNDLFPDSWVGRLRTAGMHYYIHGF